MSEDMNHLNFLEDVAEMDVAALREKEKTYRGSWKKSGGVNAWHMARRKIDRLMNMLAPLTDSDRQNLRDHAEQTELAEKNTGNGEFSQKFYGSPSAIADLLRRAADAEDIFVAMRADTSGADGTVLAEVRDLRRYLMLFEAGLQADLAKGVDRGRARTLDPKPLPNTGLIDPMKDRLVPRFISEKQSWKTGDMVGVLVKVHSTDPSKDLGWKREDGTEFIFGDTRYVWATVDGNLTKVYRSYADYCDD